VEGDESQDKRPAHRAHNADRTASIEKPDLFGAEAVCAFNSHGDPLPGADFEPPARGAVPGAMIAAPERATLAEVQLQGYCTVIVAAAFPAGSGTSEVLCASQNPAFISSFGTGASSFRRRPPRCMPFAWGLGSNGTVSRFKGFTDAISQAPH
jgi:hypothetical protein